MKIIDTQGFSDSEGNDSRNIEAMVLNLKEEYAVNTFVIVLNGEAPRITDALKVMFKMLTEIFGNAMWGNAIFVYTRWAYDQSSKIRRNGNGTGEAKQQEDITDYMVSELKVNS